MVAAVELPEPKSEDGGVEAVERAFRILECFGEEGEVLTLAELARRSGLYKSTILRIAVSLERFGYMIRNHEGKYELGSTLWRLGSLYRRTFDLAELIRPELRILVEATEETASFYVRQANARVCLYRHNSPKPIRHHLSEGARLSLEGGASARILLAYSGKKDEQDPAVQEAGYSLSLGERDPDVAAIAVPVLDPAGRLRGALAVSGLITRFNDELRARALEHLLSGARRLSRALDRG